MRLILAVIVAGVVATGDAAEEARAAGADVVLDSLEHFAAWLDRDALIELWPDQP